MRSGNWRHSLTFLYHLLLYHVNGYGGQHSVQKPLFLHVKVRYILTWTIRPRHGECFIHLYTITKLKWMKYFFDKNICQNVFVVYLFLSMKMESILSSCKQNWRGYQQHKLLVILFSSFYLVHFCLWRSFIVSIHLCPIKYLVLQLELVPLQIQLIQTIIEVDAHWHHMLFILALLTLSSSSHFEHLCSFSLWFSLIWSCWFYFSYFP